VSEDRRLEAFATFPARLREAVLGAPDRPAKPGDWTPTEVVRHLIAVEEEVHVRRLREVTTQDDPHWTWTEPGLAPGYDDATVDDVLTAFAVARAATVAMYQSVDDEAWNRAGTHATFGRLDVPGLLTLAIDHDAEHLRALGD